MGQSAVVGFELQVAAVTETVMIVSPAPRMSAGLGSVIVQQQIGDLPLNGRTIEDLALLEPGVFTTNNRNGTALYTHGNKLNINGAGPRSNAFLLDGNSTTDFFNNGLGSAAGNVLGVDAVREFRVLTGGFNAAYGGVNGGIVSVVSRSGSNTTQGSAFEFFRNDALDARDFFDEAKPDFTRHQFGFSLGGSIAPNRTFFFGAAEGLYERLGLTRVTTVPSIDARAGRVGPINPLVQPYIDLFPLPNGRDFGDGLAEHSFEAVQDQREGFGQVRMDHTLRPGHNVFVRYTFDDASMVEPSRYPDLPIDWASRSHFLTAQAGQVLGSGGVNTIRFGISKTDVGQTDAGPRSTSADLAVIAGRPAPQLVIGGMPNYGTLTAPTTRAVQDIWSIADELTLARGSHLLKIGGSVDRYHAVSDYQFFYGGRYSFPNIQRFLAGRSSVLLIALPGADTIRDLTQTTVATFAQDEIRLSPSTTLNLGLRWEFSAEPDERSGKLVGLPDPLRDTTVTVGRLFDNHKVNLAPRVGFSWQPGQGTTAIRLSAGRYFDVNNLPYIAQVLNNTPYFDQVTISAPAFPNTVFPTTIPSSLSVPSYDWKTPEMIHYNASIERTIRWDVAVSATYAGSRGINLVRLGDLNTPLPQTLADGTSYFPAGAPRRNPSFGAISLRTTSGRSWYDALLLDARRRLKDGLQFQVSYTLSRTTDEVQGALPTEALGSVTQWYDPDDPSRDRGLADFHRRHSLRINAVWELPYFRQAGGLTGALLGRWSMTGILTALSGNPFTPGIQADWTRTLVRVSVERPNYNPGFGGDIVRGGPDQYFDPSAFALQPQGTFGNVGRNPLIGPGLMTLDLGAFKEVGIPSLGPSGRLQFRVEVFNALNHTNFGMPQRLVFAGSTANEQPLSNAGRITTTTTPARQAQMGIKLLW